MGMYNEVHCKCPECGTRTMMQISQIRRGFGGFDLQDRGTLTDLAKDELELLHEYVCDGTFRCESCGHSFNPLRKQTPGDAIGQLFGI